MKPYYVHGIRLVVFTALLLGLLGCTSSRMKAINAEEIIQGTWKSAHSVAVYEIALLDGEMAVKGHSSHSGKELLIRGVSWDGETLKFTSYLPSTNFKVFHENRIVDHETMTSLTTGKSTHTVIWKKEK